MYEVWEMESGKRIGSFDTADETFSWLDALVQDRGAETLDNLEVGEAPGEGSVDARAWLLRKSEGRGFLFRIVAAAGLTEVAEGLLLTTEGAQWPNVNLGSVARLQRTPSGELAPAAALAKTTSI